MGVTDAVEAIPVTHGYMITIGGTPAVNIGVRRTCEPHTVVSVEISGPKHRPGTPSRVSCFNVDSAVSSAISFIAN